MSRRLVAVLGLAALTTLAWPGAASGETSLGGYTGYALAQPVHLEIFDPVLPLPSDPQVDVSVAYTKASTQTGPVSRATASYLWPGDVLGDGFSQLVGGNTDYPIQVNSKYPATDAAPAKDTAQLTEGNGMTTSSGEGTTTANVTGLGIAGPGTDPLTGIGTGLGKLLGQKTDKTSVPDLPVPVSKSLAGLVTVQNVRSTSTTTLAAKTFTASARATASEIKVLGGILTINGFDMTASTTSDGAKATHAGHATIGSIGVAGQTLTLNDDGIGAAGSKVRLPALPDALAKALDTIGISIKVAPTDKQVQGASGTFRAQGLVISIDTKPLRTALLNPLFGILKQIVSKLPPQLSDQLGPMLNLAPRIVVTIGDVRTSAEATKGYAGGPIPIGPTGNGGTGGGIGGTGGTNGTGGTGGGTGGTGGTGGSLGSSGDLGSSGGNAPSGTGQTPTTTTPEITPTAFDLPGLGDVPRALILAGLALAAGLGWVLRTAGGFLLGGGRDCRYGLATGVPDLRKG